MTARYTLIMTAGGILHSAQPHRRLCNRAAVRPLLSTPTGHPETQGLSLSHTHIHSHSLLSLSRSLARSLAPVFTLNPNVRKYKEIASLHFCRECALSGSAPFYFLFILFCFVLRCSSLAYSIPSLSLNCSQSLLSQFSPDF